MTAVLLGLIMSLAGGSTKDSINLADFGRAVEYLGDTPETFEVRTLERGVDGWLVWQDEAGRSMIGYEWDEPRDIAQAEVEFRHAIADRDQVRVEYFQHHWPHAKRGGWAPLDDPFHGRWVPVLSEWWAGDRDVGFAFLPYHQEKPGEASPPVTFRRTYRLRFVFGKRQEELPRCRYIRVYGPGKVTHAAFRIRCERGAPLRPPLDVTILNGYSVSTGNAATSRTTTIDDESEQLRIRFFEGDTTTPNRTIVTLRDPANELKGVSFLPAEVAERGWIRIPALGVTIHRADIAPPESAVKAGYNSIYDRIASEPEQTWERARREIPPLIRSRQRPDPLYLPLGPPEARQEIAVGYDASIYLSESSLKVPAADHERRHWPADDWRIRVRSGSPPNDTSAEGVVRQRRLEDWLPILLSQWSHQGVRYEQTAVATWLLGEPQRPRGDETVVLLVRVRATNTTSSEIPARIELWPEPEETWRLEGSMVWAEGRHEQGQRQPAGKAWRRFLVTASGGELATGREATGDVPGLRWTCPLLPGESATLEYRVPFVSADEAEAEALAALRFEEVLTAETARWKGWIQAAAPLSVPEPLLTDFYKAQLTHILITADRDPHTGMAVLPAATYKYNVCLNEACHQIRALEIRGLHAEAEKYLEAILRGQSSRPLHGRFRSAEGVLHGLPSRDGDYQTFNYNLDHGFALWMLNEHYRFTRDRGWLERVAPHLVAACGTIIRERHIEGERDTLAEQDVRWGRGLLPPGHLEDPPEWLWWFAVNAYAARGLRMTAESLAEIGHPEADRLREEAERFDRCLGESCRESMIRAPVVRLSDGNYVPFQPTRSRLRGRDLGWIRDALYGPIHLIDCGVFPDDSPEAEWILRDAEDNVFIGGERGRELTDVDKQWFSWGGITLQANLLPNPLVYLRRGQRAHAIRAFYNSLAANVYEDVRTFTEHPIEAYGLGWGPFFKSPDESAFIVWLRHLLVCEKGEDLLLLAGAPKGWLEPGRSIILQRAPTWFGPVSLQTSSFGDPPQLIVRLEGPTRNPPRSIVLPLGRPVRSVTVNGQRHSTVDAAKGIITLMGTLGRADVIISF